MVEQVYNPDHIEKAEPALCETRYFAIFLKRFQQFDIPVTETPILEPVESFSFRLIDSSVLRNLIADSVRPSLQNAKWTPKFNTHAIEADGFTALNIPPDSPRCRKTVLKIEKMVQGTGGPTSKNTVKKTSEQNRSYLQKTCPVKVRNEPQYNIYHALLLISTLLATITFHTALKLYLPGCRFQEGYESSSSLNPVCLIENQSSYSNSILVTFNSVVFFLSTALMMILFNQLPSRPWLLVLVFSMVGSYICTLMDPVNPSLLSY